MTKLWQWIAWSKKRERICDCGVAWSDTADGAEVIAMMSLGGPHCHLVDKIEVRPILESVEPWGPVQVKR